MILAVLCLTYSLSVFSETTPASPLSREKRASIAKEISANLGLEREVQKAVGSAENFLKKDPPLPDPAAKAAYKKSQAAALADFQSKSAAVKAATLDDMQNLISNTFSDSELTYLATATKYNVVAKLVQVVLSEQFNAVLQKPFAEVSQSMKNARGAAAKSSK